MKVGWRKIETMRAGAALVASIAYGAGVWAASPAWNGHAEPWDGSMSAYVLVVTIGGLLAMISPRGCPVVPAGLVVGQGAFMILALPSGPLAPLGMVFMVIATLPAGGVACLIGMSGIVAAIERAGLEHRTDAACPNCGYSLRGLDGKRCPECGREIVG